MIKLGSNIGFSRREPKKEKEKKKLTSMPEILAKPSLNWHLQLGFDYYQQF